MLDVFAACAPGIEPLLLEELLELGATDMRTTDGGVTCRGDLAIVARANLRSSLASRILLRIGAFGAPHLNELERKAQFLPWHRYLLPDRPLRIDVSCRGSRIYHTEAAEERIRRAIGKAMGVAPVVTPRRDGPALLPNSEPPARVHVRILVDRATVSIDSSGAPLHRRGYRQQLAKAPLRETLAAASLRFCRWHTARHNALVDPLCGSGTLVIEAATMRAGMAPGAQRSFAFTRWPRWPAGLWEQIQAETRDAPPACSLIAGSDRDPGAVDASRNNALRAGVDGSTQFTRRALSEIAAEASHGPGLLICNPPYGQRLGDLGTLRNLYATLGQLARGAFSSWDVGIVTSDAHLARATGLHFTSVGPVWPHGGLKIRLYLRKAPPQALT